MLRTFLLIILLFTVTALSAQKIRGVVSNQRNEPLIGCSVGLFAMNNQLIKTTLSNTSGLFVFDSILQNTCRIKISYTGYEDLDTVISNAGVSIVFLRITLTDKVYDLKNTEIKGYVNPVKTEGDTTVIKADGFKTNPDAQADELVNKMPGISTQDGKVQAQGEDVKQVFVDGKPFMGGNDPNAVLKNIPADLIDMVQVFDRKSDQSLFTGIDDGNASKTINIVTKSAFRNGRFGKVYGGVGTDNRYKSGLILNDFNKDRRITLLMQFNNVNEQNFSMEDLSAMTGSSMMPGAGGGGGWGSGSRPMGVGMGMGQGMRGMQGSTSNFMVDQAGGVVRTYSGGINYSNKWKNIDFTASYFFNQSQSELNNDINRQFFSSFNTGLNYVQLDTSITNNYNHRASMRIDVTLDSANSVLIQPRFSIQKNNYRNFINGSNILPQEGISLSENQSENNNDFEAITISVPLLFRHSFKKTGRTLSLNINPSYNVNSGNNLQYSEIVNLNDTTLSTQISLYTAPGRSASSVNSNLSFTEALNSHNFIVVSYLNNLNANFQRRRVYDRQINPFNNTIIDTILSTELFNDYNAHSGALAYRYQQENFNFSAGVNYQYAYLGTRQELPVSIENTLRFNTVLPSASLQYRFSKKSNIRINYRTVNNPPRPDQLSDAFNLSNPLSVTSGNANLKQDFQHTLFGRYLSSNPVKGTSFFIMLGGAYTNRFIGNQILIATTDTFLNENILLSKGAQFTSPVNLNSFYSGRFYTNYSFSLTKLKLKVNFSLGATYSNTPGIINRLRNQTQNQALNGGLTISSNISEKVDFTLSSNSNVVRVLNQLQPEFNTDYIIQTSKLRMNLMPWKGLVLQSDIQHQYINGLSASFNTRFVIWNAAVGYKFLKNKQADLRLYVFDLLRQNRSIQRNVSDNYYEDVQANVLTQYSMLIFTYNIRSFRMQK
ncbi:hypothetical protein LBMAG25_05410 [Bacteroidota bacterium]|nr:hypothetical protein LBMAG25_05410 [Bacteroidota bacterium]